MNTKTTITVLMIAILLGAYFVLFETDLVRKNPSDDAAPTTIDHPASGQPLFAAGILPTQVQQLTLTLANHPAFTAEREGTGPSATWKQTTPFAYELTGWKIDELITNALKLHYTSRIKPSDLAAYDLKSPQATLVIKTDQGSHTLKLGAVAPAGGAYLMLDDQPDVYVVDSDLHTKLIGQTPADFRSTSLPNIPFGQVQKVALHHDATNLTIARSSAQTTDWAFEQGASGRASSEAVESVVNAINFASIEKFVADQPADLARFGLAQPSITLTVTQSQPVADAKAPPATLTHTLKIGSPTDLNDTAYYAMFDDNPVVFTLAKSGIDRLTVPLSDLRDSRLTPVNQADAREISITRADDASVVVHLIKSEGHWSFGDPKPAYALEPASVDQLLNAIFKTKATSYIDLSKPGESHDLARITLTQAGSSQPEELTIFDHAPAHGTVIVRRGNEATGYVVDRSAMSSALGDKLFFRDRTVLDVQPADITAIHIERHGTFPANFDIQRDASGQFDLNDMDNDAVQSFIKAITPLRAAAWKEDATAFKSPDQIVKLTTKDGATHTIELSRDASLGHTQAGTFSLNMPTIDALFAELRDRVVVPLDVSQIASISYEDTTITRDAGGQITVKGASVSSKQAGLLLDSLAGLKAEHFIPKENLKMDLDHPQHTLTITPHQGRPLKLSIWPANQNDLNLIVGQVDDGPLFTLAGDPIAKTATAK